MAFDPMAAAVDWLDAYRAGDIEAILDMHADDAMVHCSCGDMKTIAGKEGLRAYWADRLQKHPASELDDLKPDVGGTSISYVTGGGVVNALLRFDSITGKIRTLTCGPL
jgi:hypothetical protein